MFKYLVSSPTLYRLRRPRTLLRATQYLQSWRLIKDFDFKLTNTVQLDVIDELREPGVRDFVAIPQLVVVGDQSSGKSSILEALLELPFARDSGLCKRFVKQITMRKSPMTILQYPSFQGRQHQRIGYDKLKQEGLTALNCHGFIEVFEEACKVIPIPGQELEPGQVTFSNDALKIELCSSNRQNLSIIDTLGIFRTPLMV